MLRLAALISVMALLSGCASDLSALAKDHETACISQTVVGPGWTETIILVRSNSQSDSAASGSPCAINHGGGKPATVTPPSPPSSVQ
jgi:hypothetical protein